MPSNPKVTPDAARATAPAMTPLPSDIASGLSGGFEEMLRIIKPPLCHLVQTAGMGRLIHVRHVNYCRNLRTSRPCGFEAETRVELPQTVVDSNTKRPITPTRTTRNRTPRVDRGPLKVALFPSSLSVPPLAFLLTLAVGPLAFLLALLFVALACILALPFVALRPLLIRLQITLQCSRFYVSSP